LKIATKKSLFNLIKQDLNKKLKIKSRSIDEVYCLDVLEHINKDKELLSEINRVLKNEGRFTLFVPAIQSIYSYWDKKLGHFRRYSRADLIETLQENNFIIEYSTYFFFFTLPLTTIVRFIKTLTGSNNTDFFPLPKWVNQILFTVSKFEGRIAKIFPIPIGSSILIIARKK
jgi:ubiquinone/menaquinone biosynthesis C-methylase UbiE